MPTIDPIVKGLGVTAAIANIEPGKTYTLDWGDQTPRVQISGQALNQLHEYAKPGIYTLGVYFDNIELLASRPLTIVVPPLILHVTPQPPTTGIKALVTVTATGLLENKAYSIDWGDNTAPKAFPSTPGAALTYGYDLPGQYDITVQAIDPALGSKSAPTRVTIIPTPPTLILTGNGLDGVLTLKDLTKATYHINWGDGFTQDYQSAGTADSPALQHLYGSPGLKTVTVTPDGAPPVVATVQLAAPQPTLNIIPSPVTALDPVSATLSTLVSSVAYTVNWGDGTPDQPVNSAGVPTTTVTHTYAVPGTFTVTLKSPFTRDVTQTLQVQTPVPVLQVQVNRLQASLNLTRVVAGLTYTVSWGDNSPTDPLTGAAPTHTYASPGTYAVTVKAPDGTQGSAQTVVAVPPFTLSVNPSSAQAGDTFTAAMTDLVRTLTYTLDWQDGMLEAVTGVDTAPRTHTYAAAGPKTVTLSGPNVTGAPAAPPVTAAIMVTVPTPVMALTGSNVTATLRVTRLALGTTYTVEWEAGKPEPFTATAASATLTHTYASPGMYAVRVTPAGGAAVTQSITLIRSTAPAPGLIVQPTAAGVYSPVVATLSGLLPDLTYTLNWDDGPPVTIIGGAPLRFEHTYATPGNYTVTIGAPVTPKTTQGVTVTVPVPTFTVTSASVVATADLRALVPQVTYSLNWGDGSAPEAVTGKDSAQPTHSYRQPGTYQMGLSAPGLTALQVPLVITVTPAVLDVTAAQLTATARITGLEPKLAYSVDWGDGTVVRLEAGSAATPVHAYALPGTYAVRVSTPGTPDVVRPLTVSAAEAQLTVIAPELRATGTLTGLLPAATYTLDWGDGKVETFSSQTSVTLSHLYGAPGNYTVRLAAPSLPPVVRALIVGLPPMEVLRALPDPARPDIITLNITQLLQDGAYVVNWGDGQTEPLTFTGTTGRFTHQYRDGGTSVLTLSLRLPDGTLVTRTASPVQVQLPLTLSSVRVTFTRPQQTTTLSLDTLDPFEVGLTVQYTGSGTLTGDWLRDGQVLQSAALPLPVGRTEAVLNLPLSDKKPGQHTVSFRITNVTATCPTGCTPSAPPAANTVTYALNIPTTLRLGGLDVRLTDVTSLDPQAFGGTGTLSLVIGGTQVQTPSITFSGLQVTRAGTTATATGGAPTVVNLDGTQLRTLGLGDVTVYLNRLTLEKDTARVSGTVTLPGQESSPLAFDAPLSAGGDLYTEVRAVSPLSVRIGETGLTAALSSGTLDLSATRNADSLADAYRGSTRGAPGPDWMGLSFPDARVTVGAPLVTGTAVTLQAPLAYTLGGFVTALDLSGSDTIVAGWSMILAGLKVTVAANAISTVDGTGSVMVPLVNEKLAVKLGWNPLIAGTASKWTVTSSTPLPAHSFGRTSLIAGTPVWERTSDGTSRLKFSEAKWDLGGVSGATVKLPLYDLTLTADGAASLGGREWASATGLTNFSLYKYRFPAAEVGLRKDARGEYVFSLRGKIELADKLPLSSDVKPVSFWVKDGKDTRLTIEKVSLKANVKAVKIDVSVAGTFTDGDNLEFSGEGTLTVAEKLNVAAKAAFGRDNGTSYGYVWGSVKAPGKTPFAQIEDIGLYEFHGGLALNMVWKDGKFDEPPVKAIPAGGAAIPVNVAIQAGVVLGTVADYGEKAHFDGTLGLDTTGTLAIKAKAWFFTPLDKGAFGNERENGQALIEVSVPPENPSAGFILVQACVGPNGASAQGGLDCSGVRELNFKGLLKVRGFAELYLPYSGSDHHLYIGTKENPVAVSLSGFQENSGYLMIDKNSIRAGGGIAYGFHAHDSGSLRICSWYYDVDAQASLRADFAVVYQPVSFDASVDFSASASASAGGCGINVGVSAAVRLRGELYISGSERFFDGNASASISLPVIPDINFDTHARINF